LLNLILIILHLALPLCDYKVWIDIERGAVAKCHLRNMVELNMMEEFCGHRMAECKRAAYFAVRSTKRSERGRGHRSVRKHDV
jgi:hypothetical protein